MCYKENSFQLGVWKLEITSCGKLNKQFNYRKKFPFIKDENNKMFS